MTTTLIINTQEIPAKEMEEHHIRTRRKNGLSLSGTTTVALYIPMTTVNSPSKLETVVVNLNGWRPRLFHKKLRRKLISSDGNNDCNLWYFTGKLCYMHEGTIYTMSSKHPVVQYKWGVIACQQSFHQHQGENVQFAKT